MIFLTRNGAQLYSRFPRNRPRLFLIYDYINKDQVETKIFQKLISVSNLVQVLPLSEIKILVSGILFYLPFYFIDPLLPLMDSSFEAYHLTNCVFIELSTNAINNGVTVGVRLKRHRLSPSSIPYLVRPLNFILDSWPEFDQSATNRKLTKFSDDRGKINFLLLDLVLGCQLFFEVTEGHEVDLD